MDKVERIILLREYLKEAENEVRWIVLYPVTDDAGEDKQNQEMLLKTGWILMKENVEFYSRDIPGTIWAKDCGNVEQTITEAQLI
jgi:hypothetical protein